MSIEILINMKDSSIIGIYGGSFNPPHIGHKLVAQNMLDKRPELKEIWFMVSPQNPLKKDYGVGFKERLDMVTLMTEDDPRLIPCDIERSLPSPWYTVNTMKYLREMWPHQNFALIIGEDCLRDFRTWKNWYDILTHHLIYVHNRPGTVKGDPENELDPALGGIIKVEGDNAIEVSSSEIRSDPFKYYYYLDNKVYEYIVEHDLYVPTSRPIENP